MIIETGIENASMIVTVYTMYVLISDLWWSQVNGS